MNKFVVCSSFVQGCIADMSLFCDVLLEFPKENGLVVFLDAPTGNAMRSYQELAASDGTNFVSTWIKCMINREHLNFEPIDVATTDGRTCFFELAAGVGPGTPLLVWAEHEWRDELQRHPSILLVDRIMGRRVVKRALKGKELQKVTKKRSGNININAHNVSANFDSDAAVAVQSGSGNDAAIAAAQAQIARETNDANRELVEGLVAQLTAKTPDRTAVGGIWSKLIAISSPVAAVGAVATAVGKILGS